MYSALAETKISSSAVKSAKWPIAVRHHGERLPDGYDILGRIATGAMSTVYLARHRESDFRVALKVLHASLAAENSDRVRLEREARSIAALDHASIIRPFDYGLEDGLAWLAMEYFPGRNLAEIVERRGPLRIDVAIQAVTQAAAGLQHAHDEGFVHRDVKPANLLFNSRDRLKIVDWGLVRMPERLQRESLEGVDDVAMLGTPYFMPPEQFSTPNEVSPASDIYSLGCTFYFLLTGQSPYQRASMADVLRAQRDDPIPPLRKVRRDVPRWVDEIYMRMVAKRPEDRFEMMSDVIAMLEQRGEDPTAWLDEISPKWTK